MSTPIHDELVAEQLDERELLGPLVHYACAVADYRHSICGVLRWPLHGDKSCSPSAVVTCDECIDCDESLFCIYCGTRKP